VVAAAKSIEVECETDRLREGGFLRGKAIADASARGAGRDGDDVVAADHRSEKQACQSLGLSVGDRRVTLNAVRRAVPIWLVRAGP
jgi:hypothetical protein